MTFCDVCVCVCVQGADVQPWQAFYAADTDQPPMSRLSNLGAARSNLVSVGRVPTAASFARALTRAPSAVEMRRVAKGEWIRGLHDCDVRDNLPAVAVLRSQ